MALNQILCVQISEKGNQVRSIVTCRIMDATCDIDISSWRKLSHASKNCCPDIHDYASDSFTIELENSQYVLVVIPRRNDLIDHIKARYANQFSIIVFLDPGLEFALLLSCVKSNQTTLNAKVMWQGSDTSSFESVSQNRFLKEILGVPVSSLYLAVLSNYITLTDIKCFVNLTPQEENHVDYIKFDNYKTNYYLNCWKSRNSDVTYLEFFNWLKNCGAPIVQSAYDVWRNQCHLSLSQDQDLAILNEVYEVFRMLESDVMKSFENTLEVQDLLEKVRKLCNFPDDIFSAMQSCYSISEVFDFLRRYWSFCSNQLLRDLILNHGTDDDKQMLANYNSVFDHVNKCKITRLPLNILCGNFYLAAESTEDLTITVEMDLELILVANVQHIHVEFAKSFDVHPCLMHLLHVSGKDSRECNLTFRIYSWLVEDFINDI